MSSPCRRHSSTKLKHGILDVVLGYISFSTRRIPSSGKKFFDTVCCFLDGRLAISKSLTWLITFTNFSNSFCSLMTLIKADLFSKGQRFIYTVEYLASLERISKILKQIQRISERFNITFFSKSWRAKRPIFVPEHWPFQFQPLRAWL